MSKHVPRPEPPKDAEGINLRDAPEERCLAYALSTTIGAGDDASCAVRHLCAQAIVDPLA
jgi:hypothetical protein